MDSVEEEGATGEPEIGTIRFVHTLGRGLSSPSEKEKQRSSYANRPCGVTMSKVRLEFG